MASDVEMCSKALVELGDSAISSFSEEPTGPICAQLFPELRLHILGIYPWRFNTIKSLQLDLTLDTPPTQYKFAYQLPPDMLTGLPRTVWNSAFNAGRGTPYTDFDIFEKKLLTNTERIFIDYQVDKAPDLFPSHVSNLAIAAMAAKLAFPLTEQKSAVEIFTIKAWGTPAEKGRGGLFRDARRADSQGRPSQSINSYPLIAARHGGA